MATITTHPKANLVLEALSYQAPLLGRWAPSLFQCMHSSDAMRDQRDHRHAGFPVRSTLSLRKPITRFDYPPRDLARLSTREWTGTSKIKDTGFRIFEHHFMISTYEISENWLRDMK